MKGLFLAADVSIRRATHLLQTVGDDFYGVKSHVLTAAAARERIRILRTNGAKIVWQDCKAHDTPDTVAGLAEEYKKAGADIITVHASGGVAMMQAAAKTGLGVYAVVFLTSLNQAQYDRYYQPKAVENMIEDGIEAKVSGFICPPTKVAWMKQQLEGYEHKPDIISPGTRFVGADANDQQQVESPGATAGNGADFLVIGRMVTGANDPRKAMARLNDEIAAEKA